MPHEEVVSYIERINSGEITEIYLQCLNLKDSDAVALFDAICDNPTAAKIKKIYLSSNQLTSLVIPKELTALTELYLSCNQLTGLVIPKELTALTGLYLDNNQLTNLVIPKELISLVRLDLCSNKLTSLVIPKELTSLIELYLSHNQLTSLVIPKELTALIELYLGKNQLSKFSKLMLRALKRINFKVDIQGMEINNIAPLSAEDITTNFKGQEVTFADVLMKLSLNNILLQQIKDWYWLLLNDKTMPKEMLELICKYCSIFLSLECAKNDIELQMQSAIELFSSIDGNEQFVNTLNTLVNFSLDESFIDLKTQRDEYIKSFTKDKTDFTNRFFDMLISYRDFPLISNGVESASQKFYADLQQLFEGFKLPNDLLKPKEVVEAIKLFRLNAYQSLKY